MEELKIDDTVYERFKLFVRKSQTNDPILKEKYTKEKNYYLATFIGSQLEKILDLDNETDLRLYEYLTSEQNLPRWEIIFIHSSFNRDANSNYEYDEYIGDRVLKYIFNRYITTKFNIKDVKTLTLMENTYMGFEFQAKLGEKLNFHKMIVADEKITRKMYEDVFEAFFGKLARLIRDFKGYENQDVAYTFEYLRYVLQDEDITLVTKVDPTTELKQRFDILTKFFKMSRPKQKKYYSPDKQTVTLELYINNFDHNELISSITGPSEDEVALRKELARKGIDWLNSKNFTETYIHSLRQKGDELSTKLLNNMTIASKIKEAQNRELIQRGYQIVNFIFIPVDEKFQRNKKHFIVNLELKIRNIETNEEPITQIAAQGHGNSEQEAQIDAVQKYISKMKFYSRD